MSLNATNADCELVDDAVSEAAPLLALLDDDRVALDKIPAFFGLPPSDAEEEGSLQYGLSAALPMVSTSSRSS